MGGRLPRADLLAPAIRLAEEGFPVNQILADMIASSGAKLRRFPASAALFWPDSQPLRPGDRLRNPALAAACRSCTIDAKPRALDRPSDHAPVACEIAA